MTKKNTRASAGKCNRDLSCIFEPESVAVIGASRNPSSIGYQVLHNIIKFGYKGVVYPVNPKADFIHSIKAYKSLMDIQGNVEMAVVVVPSKLVVGVMEECGKKGVKGVVMITAGFKETGEEGTKLENKVKEICEKYGMRMIGPNCMGVLNLSPNHSMNATFGPVTPQFGSVSMISQSGAMGIAILDFADDLNLGIAKFASVGNKADVKVVDLLEYFECDDETKEILLYIESLDDPLRGIEVARRISYTKPVIVVKAGRTMKGAQAASSHTGALTASDEAFSAMFRKSGMIRVRDVHELFNLALGLTLQPLPMGPRVAILTNGGGPGILATDACVSYGLEIAQLSKRTQNILRKNLAEEASIKNPIDMIASANTKNYKICSKALLEDPNVDALVAICTPPENLDPIEIAAAISEVSEGTDKPVIGVFMGRDDVQDAIMNMDGNKIPVYNFTESAAFVLSKMVSYKQWIDKPRGKYKKFKVDKKKVETIFKKVRNDGRNELVLTEAEDVFKAYGFKFPDSDLVKNEAQAVKAAEKMGYPVVIKVVSPEVLHKTDAGGVAVNLKDEKQLKAAFKKMEASVQKYLKKRKVKITKNTIWGYQVQKMSEKGREIILGSSYSPLFGNQIMVGFGGIYVEVMKDVSFNIAPVTDLEITEMIGSLHGYPILEGVRGEKPSDIPKLEESVQRFSQLIDDFPEISEVDINPLFVYPKPKPPMVVDGRIILKE